MLHVLGLQTATEFPGKTSKAVGTYLMLFQKRFHDEHTDVQPGASFCQLTLYSNHNLNQLTKL